MKNLIFGIMLAFAACVGFTSCGHGAHSVECAEDSVVVVEDSIAPDTVAEVDTVLVEAPAEAE